MTEKIIQPWIAVNGYMEDDYREIVIQIALKHWPLASPELRQYADDHLSYVTVPGFRTIKKASPRVATPHVVKAFKNRKAIANAVICLWAETQVDLIADLRRKAQSAGLHLDTLWTWKDASLGYYEFEDIPELNNICETIANETQSPTSDHYRLAALWLSRCLINTRELSDNTEENRADELLTSGIEKSASDYLATPGTELITQDVITPKEELISVQTVNLGGQLPEPNGEFKTELDPKATLAFVEKEIECSWDDMALRELFSQWENEAKKVDQARNSSASSIQTLHTSVSSGDIIQSSSLLNLTNQQVEIWLCLRNNFDKFTVRAWDRLDRESKLRPDLEKPATLGSLLDQTDRTITTLVVEAAHDYILKLEAYDKRKQAVRELLDGIQEEIAKIRLALHVWEIEPAANTSFEKPTEDVDELQLDYLEKSLQQAKVCLQLLTTQHLQLRDQCISRIRATVDSIKGISPEGHDTKINGYTIAMLNSEDYSNWNEKDLRSFEHKLLEMINQLVIQEQKENTSQLAADLIVHWDEQTFEKLHQRLALEKREVEAFLLELSATKSHPRNGQSIYSKEVIANLLSGLGQISLQSKPYELLGWIASTFLTGFSCCDIKSQAEICLIALAANLSSEHHQPTGYLYLVAEEWPVEEMPSWRNLWQSVIFEEPIQIFTDQKDSAFLDELMSIDKEVQKLFERDGAHFTRLSSLQSNRHRLLLGNNLLPYYAEKFSQLKKWDNKLNDLTPTSLQGMLEKLQKFIDEEIIPDFHEATITKRYENGLYEEGIDDTEVFHRKISLRILKECTDGILQYGNTLLDYWKLKNARSNGFNRMVLEEELIHLPSLTAIGQAALEHIVQYQAKEKVAWNEQYASRQALQHIIQEILTQTSFVIRLPRLVSNLADHYLDWDNILIEVLNDISEPMSPTEAAIYLLDMKAPYQALMLIEYLSLEKQKLAQEMRTEFEREMTTKIPELLQLGGNIDNISNWHEIGRWGYLLEKINSDIKVKKELNERRSKEIATKSLEFRLRIHELDLKLFEKKNALPVDIYETINSGVSAARRASEVENLFPDVEEFLRDIGYRVEHNSWQPDELQKVVNQLEKAFSKVSEPSLHQLSVDQVLQCFENENLIDLNLSRKQVDASEINTRVNLLKNWGIVKQTKGVLKKDINQTGVNAIQVLFRNFAQMVAMKKFRNIDNKEMVFENPLVYEYWQLQYPRTAALDNQCILIALPGHPPTISDAKLVQELIEDKGFLEDYFVFLFIPGADEKIIRRFQGMSDAKGLVILDEKALLQMVLAETENIRPVGRLRPMMLDAIQDNTKIFTVNQTVDQRTAIFVGRDRLIDNIVHSGSNYPIYGGRRIGKSSLLKAIEQRLVRKNIQVISYTLEGDRDLSDDAVSRQLAEQIGLHSVVFGKSDFKTALLEHMDRHQEVSLTIILDEVDRYIQVNKERHTLIEGLRAASDRFGNRFRVVIAGFMELFDCLSGRGPYSQTSDPWRRMLDNEGPLGNLTSVNAEQIVTEGFLSILGWNFENRAIPQLIVERTGGHPAFVQEFCLKILDKVRERGDRLVRIDDIDAVFNDNDPRHSFIAYVRETLEMNLDAVGRYLVVMLATRPVESLGFTWDEIREIADSSNPPISEERLKRSLEYLSVTSVIREVSKQLYEYTVPDYPNILNRLGDTGHLDELEEALKKELGEI